MDQDWKQCVQYSAHRLLEYKLEMRLYRQAEARSQRVLKLPCKRGAGFYFMFQARKHLLSFKDLCGHSIKDEQFPLFIL